MNDLCGRVAALITSRPLVLFGFVSVTAFLFIFSSAFLSSFLLLSFLVSQRYSHQYSQIRRKNVSRLVTPRSFSRSSPRAARTQPLKRRSHRIGTRHSTHSLPHARRRVIPSADTCYLQDNSTYFRPGDRATRPLRERTWVRMTRSRR